MVTVGSARVRRASARAREISGGLGGRKAVRGFPQLCTVQRLAGRACGAFAGCSPSNSVTENSLAAAQKKHAHPAGPRLGDSAGTTEGFERVGGSPLSKIWERTGFYVGLPSSRTMEMASRTSPQQGPVARPKPPGGRLRRLQRRLRALLGLAAQGVGLCDRRPVGSPATGERRLGTPLYPSVSGGRANRSGPLKLGESTAVNALQTPRLQ